MEAKYINARDDNVKGIAAYGVLESKLSTLEEAYEESQRFLNEAKNQLHEMQQEFMEMENENDALKCAPPFLQSAHVYMHRVTFGKLSCVTRLMSMPIWHEIQHQHWRTLMEGPCGQGISVWM